MPATNILDYSHRKTSPEERPAPASMCEITSFIKRFCPELYSFKNNSLGMRWKWSNVLQPFFSSSSSAHLWEENDVRMLIICFSRAFFNYVLSTLIGWLKWHNSVCVHARVCMRVQWCNTICATVVLKCGEQKWFVVVRSCRAKKFICYECANFLSSAHI